MGKLSVEVEITFKDLSDVFEQLRQERNSPKNVRRLFSHFIMQAQKLTNMMRKEFKAVTGRDWEAQRFPHWDAVSKAFKKFRNVDQHESNILIHVRERQYIAVNDIFRDQKSLGSYIVFEGTWPLDDPFADNPPEGLGLYRADPETGKMTNERISPKAREFQFLVAPKTDDCRKALERAVELIGGRDVHILCEHYFNTLKEYFEFYQKELAKNR